MASTAQSGQRSKIYIAGTPDADITITAVARGTTTDVTGTNTLAVGDVVVFGDITGMPELEGDVGLVTVASGSAFTVAIDSSDFDADGTDGTAAPQTFTKIGNVLDWNGFDGSASELDKTNLDSRAMENSPGLQDSGQFTFNIDVDDDNTGVIALRTAKTGATIQPFKIRHPNGKLRAWNGWVKKFTETGGVNKIIKSAVDIRVTGVVQFGADA